ncbi:uncharacterized protein V1516DRAFT_665011 [Lipomyces oligophaga]|uniref:uncharacterized protein n=1 Tax=Lipomyces oligophaga TaxID=45792 RepID=UPI0034CDD372
MPARATSLPSISSASSFVHKPFRFWQRNQEDRTSGLSSVKKRRWWAPATLRRLAITLLGFNVLPVTILAIATYASLLITTFVIQYANPQTASPAAISAAPGSYSPSVEQAWYDLQVISENMHPYNSHANQWVHDYILNRTYEIANYSTTPGYIEVYDDYGRNVTFRQADLWNPDAPSGKIIYYESNNILVKVQGSNQNLPAVLASAHFDSVATSYGTTDDGTGVVTLLAMLDSYARSGDQPLRTIIFLFNNAEEVGLYGAEAFFFHPWSEMVSTFYNLEGTGAGGRSVLFRASDYGVADHYSAADTPHANSLLQDGFEHGVIRSETDYRAYEDHGLRGMDVAFYTPRSVYHTEGDSIQGTTRGSVEHMLTTSAATVDSMANDPNLDNSSKSKAVFFDLFGEALFVAPVQTFFVVDTVMLVVTPIILFLLLFGLAKSRKLNLGKRGWGRFPASIIISTAILFGVMMGLRRANGFILYSHVGLPFIALFSLYFVLNWFILAGAHRFKPVRHQKFKVLLELYFLWWIVLVYANVEENRMSGTGLYWITFNFVGVSVALLLDIIALYFEPPAPMYFMSRAEVIGSDQHYMEAHDGDIDHIAPHSEQEDDDDDDDDSEDSPLMGDDASEQRVGFAKKLDKRIDFVWLFEFLILVPFSVFLTSQIGFLALAAVRQTLQEGGPSMYNVYLSLFVFLIILMYPILPFMHRIHVVVPFVLLLAFIGTYIASCFIFPFSSQQPMKMTFLQQIDLDNLDAGAVVTVTGLSPYVENSVRDLPSVKNESWYSFPTYDIYDSYIVNCTDTSVSGIQKCQYPGLYPNITYGYPFEWLNVTATNSTFNFTEDPTATYTFSATATATATEEPSSDIKWESFFKADLLQVRHNALPLDVAEAVTDTYNATIEIFANNSRTCVVQFEPPFEPFTFTGYGPNSTSEEYSEDYNTYADGVTTFGKYIVTSVSVSTNYTDANFTEPLEWEDGIDKITLFKLDWDSPFLVSLMWKDANVDDVEDAAEQTIDDDYLKVYVGCQWAEWLPGQIPALDELDKYRPSWTAVTKSGVGLVEVWKELNLNGMDYYVSPDHHEIIDI